MGVLYVVATPIGNLEDITLRAMRVLREVDFIACEDTRVTRKLLSHFDIHTPLISYHSNSGDSKVEKIIELLADGKNIALVCDAGTPTISDPGSFLVSQVREKLPEVSVQSVPGPSALTSALSIAGIPSNEFVFFGFLPHKKGRETLFKEIAELARVAVLYESPHRILKTLESLEKFCPKKEVVIVRELTKIYEEVLGGSARELLDLFEKNPEKVRGEFVVIVGKH